MFLALIIVMSGLIYLLVIIINAPKERLIDGHTLLKQNHFKNLNDILFLSFLVFKLKNCKSEIN